MSSSQQSKPNDAVKIREILLNIIGDKHWTRKALIMECIKHLDLSPQEMKDKSPSSVLTNCKSLTGTVITSLVDNNDFKLDDNYYVYLAKKTTVIIEEERVRQTILSFLANKKVYTKASIVNYVKQSFFPSQTEKPTEEDKKMVTKIVGDSLKLLYQNAMIKKNKGGYQLKEKEKKADLKVFIDTLNKMGGEFLEEYVVHLFGIYYKNRGYEVLSSEVTGGSNDNGIDGKIELEDDLGFHEMIFLQTKVRKTEIIGQNDVRNFYGSMKAFQAQKGIFVTTSSFHRDALKFMKRLPDFIAVEKKKLFELAKKTGYGLCKKKDSWYLDEKIFPEEIGS